MKLAAELITKMNESDGSDKLMGSIIEMAVRLNKVTNKSSILSKKLSEADKGLLKDLEVINKKMVEVEGLLEELHKEFSGVAR